MHLNSGSGSVDVHTGGGSNRIQIASSHGNVYAGGQADDVRVNGANIIVHGGTGQGDFNIASGRNQTPNLWSDNATVTYDGTQAGAETVTVNVTGGTVEVSILKDPGLVGTMTIGGTSARITVNGTVIHLSGGVYQNDGLTITASNPEFSTW